MLDKSFDLLQALGSERFSNKDAPLCPRMVSDVSDDHICASVFGRVGLFTPEMMC